MNDCNNCYWKIINEGKDGFCYMFKKRIENCQKFESIKYINR